jgi:hypothetical protein
VAMGAPPATPDEASTSESQHAIGYEQRIIVDDIIDPRLCRQRGDRCGDRVIDVNERPDRRSRVLSRDWGCVAPLNKGRRSDYDSGLIRGNKARLEHRLASHYNALAAEEMRWPNTVIHARGTRVRQTQVANFLSFGTIELRNDCCRHRLLEFRTVRLLCQILWMGFFCLPIGATGSLAQPAKDLGWETYTDANGTREDFPARLFVVRAGPAEKGVGQGWTTADGRARLSVYVLRNSEGHTPASYLNRYLTERPWEIGYKRVTRDFFAVSKYSGNRILYRRCNFSHVGNIHCVDLGYPSRDKRAWDTIVTRMSRSLRPLHP